MDKVAMSFWQWAVMCMLMLLVGFAGGYLQSAGENGHCPVCEEHGE